MFWIKNGYDMLVVHTAVQFVTPLVIVDWFPRNASFACIWLPGGQSLLAFCCCADDRSPKLPALY